MRRLLILSAALFAGACAGQSTTDPCIMKLDVQDVTSVPVGGTRTVLTELGRKSGTCPSVIKGSLTWSTDNPSIATLLASNDSTATVKGIKAGTAIITAWLSLTPSVRDSINVTVVPPVDNP